MRWGPAGQCAAIGGNSLGPQDADLWITPSEIADVFFYGGGESAAEQRRQIPVQPSPSPVRQWEDSTMARYLEAALSQLAAASLQDHPYVWLDLPLFSGPWDAPVEWRSYLAGEDSPELYQGVAPPACRLSGPAVFGLDAEHGFEPDQRMAWEHAAGSMVMLLDHGLEWLEKALAAIESVSPWTKVLTSCSGFSLGEHQAIGHAADSVWIEETQVPLLISWGHADSYPLRIPGAQAVADWWPLLKQWTLQPMATNLTKSG